MKIPFWLKLFKSQDDSKTPSKESINKMAFYLSQNKKIIFMGKENLLEIKIFNNQVIINSLIENKDFNWR
jgi:hypothetical protein